MMHDWPITCGRPVMVGVGLKSVEPDNRVDGTSRNVAIPLGIDEIFKREAANEYQLVPKEAVDYWNQWRMTGGQLYEFQSELEGKWGISFGISEVQAEAGIAPPPSHRAQRNGAQAPTG